MIGTQGPVFSAEFRQEMQKEIERNLNLRNEIRHRIITADSTNADKKKSQEGLKYLVSERENAGLASLSTSTSSSTNSSILSTVMKKEMIHTTAAAVTNTAHNLNPPAPLASHTIHTTNHHTSNISNTSNTINNIHHQHSHQPNTLQASSPSPSNTVVEEEPKAPVLRPASFLTGFGGFGSETGLGIGGNFITRGIPPRGAFAATSGGASAATNALSASRGDGPSISTRFFQRLASRLDDYDKKVPSSISK